MTPRDIETVRSEISFWMEKCFQVSFGYLGALVAGVALSRRDALEPVSIAIAMKPEVLIPVLILLMNFAYVTVATACVFAVLKRGYYILLHPDEAQLTTGSTSSWEHFVRRNTDHPFGSGMIGELAWNVDNYYMAPLFLFIFLGSILAFTIGWSAAECSWQKVVLLCAGCLHAIPAGAVLATGRLNSSCRAAMNAAKPAPTKP